MKKVMMFVFVALFIAGFSFAQSTTETTVTQQEQSGDTTVKVKKAHTVGTIKSIDPATKTITIVKGDLPSDDPSAVTVYKFDDKTAFTSSGKTIEITELKAGDKITFVTSESSPNNLVTVKVGDTEIQMEPEKK